ncbi:hypothetical protein NPIL_600021, partial [Nephila pilipes]
RARILCSTKAAGLEPMTNGYAAKVKRSSCFKYAN